MMEVKKLDVAEVKAKEALAGVIDGREVAVFSRDGQLTVLENVCTHRGCQTIWNAQDRTWDCPCHGSRYSADGQVIQGPARRPLKALNHIIADGEIKLEA